MAITVNILSDGSTVTSTKKYTNPFPLPKPCIKGQHDWVFISCVGDEHCHKCNQWMNND